MWASEVFKSCGVNCGHQAVFRHRQSLGESVDWGHCLGDASFEAVPRLAEIDAVRVLIVRDPLAVMRSWRSLGLFVDTLSTWEHWGLLSRVLDRYYPAVLAHPDGACQAALFWYYWNRTAVASADHVFKLEGLEPRTLFEAVGRGNQYRTCADEVSRTTNTRAEDKAERGPHGWDEIEPGIRDMVRAFAAQIGYP